MRPRHHRRALTLFLLVRMDAGTIAVVDECSVSALSTGTKETPYARNMWEYYGYFFPEHVLMNVPMTCELEYRDLALALTTAFYYTRRRTSQHRVVYTIH